jgi:hypothetical protein
MDFLPQVVRASYERAFRIRLTFNDGIEASVDFQGWLTGEVFEPLKKASYFKKFFIDGGTVVWPNGADIAPETLYEAATRSNLATLQPTAAGIRRRRG